MKRLLALVLVVMACSAPAASASTASTPPLKNAAVATDGLLYAAVEAGDDYWRSLKQQPRCKAEVYVYDAEPRSDGRRELARGSMPGCWVAFDRSYVDDVRRDLRRPYGFRWRRQVYEQLCRVAAHERGHNLGLDHGTGGIMDDLVTPRGVCRAWAITVAPSNPRELRGHSLTG